MSFQLRKTAFLSFHNFERNAHKKKCLHSIKGKTQPRSCKKWYRTACCSKLKLVLYISGVGPWLLFPQLMWVCSGDGSIQCFQKSRWLFSRKFSCNASWKFGARFGLLQHLSSPQFHFLKCYQKYDQTYTILACPFLRIGTSSTPSRL